MEGYVFIAERGLAMLAADEGSLISHTHVVGTADWPSSTTQARRTTVQARTPPPGSGSEQNHEKLLYLVTNKETEQNRIRYNRYKNESSIP